MSDFQAVPATRQSVPILLGLFGPSGCGKTFSALRLAEGIRRVHGGETFVIDTENRRSLQYADAFQFKHVPFNEPFSSARYLEALRYCIGEGASTIVVDSGSHEWDGEGGVLDMKEQFLNQFDERQRDRNNARAWNHAKGPHKKLLTFVERSPVHMIWTFQAKDATDWSKSKPEKLGWVPVTGDRFLYRFQAAAYLPPLSEGKPNWNPRLPGEMEMVKCPGWAKPILQSNPQLCEDIGERLARWALGDGDAKTTPPPLGPISDLAAQYASVSSPEAFEALEEQRRELWGTLTDDQRTNLKRIVADAKAGL